jgi:hypothetical protein
VRYILKPFNSHIHGLLRTIVCDCRWQSIPVLERRRMHRLGDRAADLIHPLC